jgi:hypothetical protein
MLSFSTALLSLVGSGRSREHNNPSFCADFTAYFITSKNRVFDTKNRPSGRL